jgi:hypothetical protein
MEKEIKKEDSRRIRYLPSDKEVEVRRFCIEAAGRRLEEGKMRGVLISESDLLRAARNIEAYILTGEILTK